MMDFRPLCLLLAATALVLTPCLHALAQQTTPSEAVLASLTSADDDAPRQLDPPPPDATFPVLIGVGGTLLAAGILVAAMSVRDLNDICCQAEQGNIPCPFADNPTDEQIAYRQLYDKARMGIAIGANIAVLGGITMAISIPVSIHQARTRTLSLAARVDRPLDGGLAPTGFHLSVVFR